MTVLHMFKKLSSPGQVISGYSICFWSSTFKAADALKIITIK